MQANEVPRRFDSSKCLLCRARGCIHAVYSILEEVPLPFQEHAGTAMATIDGNLATESGLFDHSGAMVQFAHSGLSAWFQYDSLPIRVELSSTYMTVFVANAIRTGELSPGVITLWANSGQVVWNHMFFFAPAACPVSFNILYSVIVAVGV